MVSATIFKIQLTYILIIAFLIVSCEDSHYIEKDKEVKIISKNINGDKDNPDGPNLNKVVAVSKDKAWSCDSTGLMLLTLNEGNDWQDFDLQEKINDILFLDENKGWIITDKKIYYTNNACLDIILQKELQTAYYRDLSFKDIANFDDKSISIALNTNYMAVSTNSGNSWYFANVEEDIEISHTIFPEKSKVFYISNKGIRYNEIKNDKIINKKLDIEFNLAINDISNSGKLIWLSTTKELFLTDVEFINKIKLYECEEDQEIISIDMINKSTGMILIRNSNGCVIKFTEDNGKSWDTLFETDKILMDIDFYDSKNGFAVGNNIAITIKR